MTERQARHLAFLIPSGAGGGVQRVMTTLAKATAGLGRQVDLVVGRAEGPFVERLPENVNLVALEKSIAFRGRAAALRADPKGFSVLAKPLLLPPSPGDMVSRLPALMRYLAKNKPDLMMSAKVHTNLAALLARRAASPETRIVVSERGDYREKLQRSRRWRWRHVAPLMGRLYREADAIVSVSEDLAARLPGYTGIDGNSIRVLHNPVVSSDLHRQAAAPIDHPWFAAKEPPVVLGAGRLEQRKGFHDLIHAFAKASATRPLRLMIFGEGKERGALEKLVATLGLGDRVLLPGWTPDLFAYMARAGLFVLPSTYEGLPGVLIQALACGCPVVSTDCPTGPREILQDGRFGHLVPMNDVDAMASAMLDTLDAPPFRQELIARAEDFSVDRAVARYLSLFDGLMGPGRQSQETALSGSGVGELPAPTR